MHRTRNETARLTPLPTGLIDMNLQWCDPGSVLQQEGTEFTDGPDSEADRVGEDIPGVEQDGLESGVLGTQDVGIVIITDVDSPFRGGTADF